MFRRIALISATVVACASSAALHAQGVPAVDPYLQRTVLIDRSGAEKGTGANPVSVAPPGASAATSAVLSGVATLSGYTPTGGSLVTTGAPNFVIGPMSPQLARDMWVTLAGTGASGTAQLLRSTDGGATKLGITAGGNPWAAWTFSATTGVIVNEQVVTPSDAAATYFLSVKLTAGSVTYRLGQ